MLVTLCLCRLKTTTWAAACMWRTQACYSYYCPSPLPDCWPLKVDCFVFFLVFLYWWGCYPHTQPSSLFIRAWDRQWRVKDSGLQQKVSVMWCNWCISTERRFLACALRVGAIQPTRMELFQHMQQIFPFLSGAYQKNLESKTVCKYENDALWDTVAAVTGEMTRATTSPSSNEIIASQKDGCNLRDSTRCFVMARDEASSGAFSSAWCLETRCDKRGSTGKPHVSITSRQPMSKPCTRRLPAV